MRDRRPTGGRPPRAASAVPLDRSWACVMISGILEVVLRGDGVVAEHLHGGERELVEVACPGARARLRRSGVIVMMSQPRRPPGRCSALPADSPRAARGWRTRARISLRRRHERRRFDARRPRCGPRTPRPPPAGPRRARRRRRRTCSRVMSAVAFTETPAAARRAISGAGAGAGRVGDRDLHVDVVAEVAKAQRLALHLGEVVGDHLERDRLIGDLRRRGP